MPSVVAKSFCQYLMIIVPAFVVAHMLYATYSLLSCKQVLRNIQVFAKAMPSLFSPHFEDFFISSTDPYQVKALKLEILSSIAIDASALSIFKEFQVLFLSCLL